MFDLSYTQNQSPDCLISRIQTPLKIFPHGNMGAWNQLKAILWKNWLLKRAHFSGFMAELLLPVFFMALLILIKNITSKYDSPNVAYHCGNAYPWTYNGQLDSYDGAINKYPFVCTQKPKTCTADHYYEEFLYDSDRNISGYSQYGKSKGNFIFLVSFSEV